MRLPGAAVRRVLLTAFSSGGKTFFRRSKAVPDLMRGKSKKAGNFLLKVPALFLRRRQGATHRTGGIPIHRLPKELYTPYISTTSRNGGTFPHRPQQHFHSGGMKQSHSFFKIQIGASLSVPPQKDGSSPVCCAKVKIIFGIGNIMALKKRLGKNIPASFSGKEDKHLPVAHFPFSCSLLLSRSLFGLRFCLAGSLRLGSRMALGLLG